MISQETKNLIDSMSLDELRFEVELGNRSRFQREKMAYLKVRLKKLEEQSDPTSPEPPQLIRNLSWLYKYSREYKLLVLIFALISIGGILITNVGVNSKDTPRYQESPAFQEAGARLNRFKLQSSFSKASNISSVFFVYDRVQILKEFQSELKSLNSYVNPTFKEYKFESLIFEISSMLSGEPEREMTSLLVVYDQIEEASANLEKSLEEYANTPNDEGGDKALVQSVEHLQSLLNLVEQLQRPWKVQATNDI